jgi:SAM-dependent methyltransferase
MSDGPVKLSPADAPDAPALDDIILGEDDHTVPIPPANPRSSAAPMAKDTDALAKAIEAGAAEDRASQRPRDRSSNRVKAADPEKSEPGKDTRKRQKMTLRIPDDEVSRPQLLDSRTPMGGVPAVGTTPSRPPSRPELDDATVAMPVQPSRIISIGADDTLELPKAELEARGNTLDGVRRAPGIDAAQEPGWTPYQPPVADKHDGRHDLGGERIVTRGHDAAAAAAKAALLEKAGRMRDPAHTVLDDDGMGAMASMMAREERGSSPPASEDIPIDTDEDEPIAHDRFDELQTSPRLPAAPSSDDIKVEEGERHTDPGEVPEVAEDDLVSVESIPNPHSPHAPPLLKGNVKHIITPAPSAVTATALMAGVPPHAAAPQAPHTPHVPLAPQSPLTPMVMTGGSLGSQGVTPIAPAVAQRNSPSTPAPAASAPNHAHAPPSSAQAPLSLADTGENPAFTAPAAGTPMARRQQPAGGPFGYMPQVGALAPPPMNESAANRKKIRPWWEDLFNDDFIRTMAKITDADIAREANFIEESLGCEAGATILDLACGTGRHAVELATRGYQVVGFDLSLAMLARASDEAQDRKQKINFVQGDMREMTFEETFDGVFSWNTSFGYFDEEKNAAVIAKVHRALKKGGQFLLDVVNRDNLVRQAPSLAWFEGDGCICMDEMGIDFITSRMKVKRTLMMDDGRTKEIEYSIRVYSLHELGKMLHDNGFRVAEVSGRTGTPGVFFGCESPRTLILAEKR